MPEATLANEESDGLRVLISKNFVHSQFESSNVERFLPRAALSSLFTEFKVKEELSSPSDDLIKFICTDAPKIFAIVLVTLPDISNLELTSVMKSFQSHTFKDEYLPIDNTGGLTCCFKRQFKDSSSSEKYDRHLNSLNVFEHKLLKDHIKDFLKNQWSFLAPEFPLSRELRMLDPRYILPFTETDYTTQKEGTFAKVFKAKLRADHSGVPQVYIIIRGIGNVSDSNVNLQANGAHEVDVAIKKFKLRDNIDLDPSEISDPKSSWSHEADNMEEIGKIGSGNPCIARVIGSFSIRGNYYIIMSWASGGNLREFWRSREPTLSGDLIMQFLVQYRNLAGALTSLHQLGGSGDGLSVISLPVPVSVPQNQENSLNDEDDDFTKQDGSNWRHGDLKPENLLRQQEGEALGTLMVGDVGLAKKHLNPTSVRQSTDTRLGTLDYEPPEAFINSNAKSRTYDIWSMGCIVFETVIWLLYGPTGQSRFYAEPYNNRTGTRYYEDGFLGKVVNRNVAKWMDHILAKDPECSGESPTVLKDLLILTRDKLLVVNPPNSYADPVVEKEFQCRK
ncbi:kinase-like domain-containing protein [Camillea tinctor]|nr:kinase-like domain-containing protein [Camillea tinctor]